MPSILDRRDLGPPASPPKLELRTILCAFDLSDASRRALGFALMIARQRGVRARVMHVARSVPGAPERAAAAAVLERACGPEVDLLLREGDPSTAILEHTADWPADLLVMGTQGESLPRPWGLGSTTDAVMRRARAPVLAVPGRGVGESAGPPRPFRRVLAAFDFSEPSRHMLHHVARLADAPELQLTLLHVVEWFPGEGASGWGGDLCVPEYQLDLAQATRERVDRAVRASALAGRPHRAEVMAGIPHREILRVAARDHADLIAVGLHSRRALDHWLPGSTISHLLRESACPVLAVNL